MKKFEHTLALDGREARLTNFIDDQSRAFEAEASRFLANAAIEQTVAYLQHCRRDFFLMQMRGPDRAPAMQASVYIGRPSGSFTRFFAMASVPSLHFTNNDREETIGLQLLKNFCRKMTGLMTLRLQPRSFDPQALSSFQNRAIGLGFRDSPPLGIVRTLILDLGATPAELLAQLPSKTRAKLRHAGRSRVQIRVLTDERFIPVCRQAANLSRERSGGDETPYDFETAFAVAKSNPEQARILGLFLNDRPDELLAYAIGFKNGTRGEFSSAGAFADPELRSMPYNYFLLWELTQWARDVGCRQFDLGGVTEGGPSDPLDGVTRFKRSVTDHEFEVGREVVLVLRPIQFFVYRALKYPMSKTV